MTRLSGKGNMVVSEAEKEGGGGRREFQAGDRAAAAHHLLRVLKMGCRVRCGDGKEQGRLSPTTAALGAGTLLQEPEVVTGSQSAWWPLGYTGSRGSRVPTAPGGTVTVGGCWGIRESPWGTRWADGLARRPGLLQFESVLWRAPWMWHGAAKCCLCGLLL